MYSFLLKFGVLCVFYAYLSSSGTTAQVQDISFFASEVDPDTAYCFRFTWLGPKWDNTSEINGTCSSVGHSPCKEPLVITQDSTPPNTTYMWLNYDLSQISCRLTRGEVCTKWVQYYAGEIEFITYMCSKYSVQGVAAVNYEGCERDSTSNSTFINEVCACRSATGRKPCNAGTHLTPLSLFTLLVGLLAATAVTALL